MDSTTIHSGIDALDEVLQGIRLGDNVVLQVDHLESYNYFVEPFAKAAIDDNWPLVYMRFASHPPVLSPRPGLKSLSSTPV